MVGPGPGPDADADVDSGPARTGAPSSAPREALRTGDPEPAPAQAEGPGAEPARPASGSQVVDGSAPDAPAADRSEIVGPLPPWSAERTVPAREDLPSGDEGAVGGPPDTGADTGADDDVARTAAEAPPAPGGPVAPISPEPVSRAVQQALAARAVRRARMLHAETEGADPSTGEQQELPLAVVPSAPSTPAAESDVRDRLLGVLLADPARALDAARRLDDSRERIEQLGDVLRRRREDLAGAVRHLNDCGLDPVQIGRLAGMATADVRTILDGEDAGRG
ncbi:hypothetical protein [Pseudonocardia parietis]|uniref:ANTAR domain-containing protein n=1 Tax=Pseudonocardia parietis TaxID=570936 RepID=A0ABS4VKB2_9PSEU|nr:hypothetical protein [Pseudonocardia parietis]MBP2364364.1 hypothetical protein [Pseudonocardia parietis]